MFGEDALLCCLEVLKRSVENKTKHTSNKQSQDQQQQTYNSNKNKTNTEYQIQQWQRARHNHIMYLASASYGAWYDQTTCKQEAIDGK